MPTSGPARRRAVLVREEQRNWRITAQVLSDHRDKQRTRARSSNKSNRRMITSILRNLSISISIISIPTISRPPDHERFNAASVLVVSRFRSRVARVRLGRVLQVSCATHPLALGVHRQPRRPTLQPETPIFLCIHGRIIVLGPCQHQYLSPIPSTQSRYQSQLTAYRRCNPAPLLFSCAITRTLLTQHAVHYSRSSALFSSSRPHIPSPFIPLIMVSALPSGVHPFHFAFHQPPAS